LANILAKAMGTQLVVSAGPVIEKAGDLAGILTSLKTGDVLFIDEIHRLNKAIEEVLYPAMESRVLDIIIGKGPSARTIQLELPPFTLVAATTRMSLMSAPLRSRFSGGVFRLSFYTEDEINEILKRSSKILNIETDKDSLREIARRSRFTPRTANYLLKRARDYAQVTTKPFSKDTVSAALSLLEIDELGLSAYDRKILEHLIEKFNGGPIGLGTLAASLSEDPSTIEDVHEPYLMQLGFLERTPRGRVATPKAYEHLGYDIEKVGKQKALL
jgi:Holliday junction DNA helicase RuvB